MRALLASLLLLAAPSFAATESNDITPDEWRFVCRTLEGMGYKVNCRNIRPPTVVVTKLVRDVGLLGVYYSGEPHVLISAAQTPEEQRIVVIHETVHYVLWQAFGVAVGRCEGEAAARAVHRLREGLPPDETWRVLYGC